MYKFLKDFLNEFGIIPKRSVILSMVDANTGAYVTFNETTKDLSKAILSSSSIPFVFPSQPWEIEGAKMVGIDGGTAWGTNLVSVVQRCRELVDSDSKITVDIVVCDSHQIS